MSLAAFAGGSARSARSQPRPAEENAVTATIPKDTILKFNPDGSPRAFAGNTVICHLPQQSRMRDAIAALGSALRTSPFASRLACLPPDSYHMTIFPGANDVDRSGYGWPADIGIDAPISECNRIIAQRIELFRMRSTMPISMRVGRERMLGSLRLVPADEAENAKLRLLRDRLAAEVFRFLDKNHAAYTFHTTLAYPLACLTPAEEHEHQAILARRMPAIMAAGPVIELGIPEYCTFQNMHRFEPQLLLRS